MKRFKEEESDIPPTTQFMRHVVFCVDRSGSMNNPDVYMHDGQTSRYISRWEAAWRCAKEFIKDQLDIQTQLSQSVFLSQAERQKASQSSVFSIVSFNTTAEVMLSRCGTSDGGAQLLRHVELAERTGRPNGQTLFASGFHAVTSVLQSHPHETPFVIFLTDGRPGDHLLGTQFKFFGRYYTSASEWLLKLRQQFGDRLNLSFLTIHDSGLHALKSLGSFCDINAQVAYARMDMRRDEIEVKMKSEDEERMWTDLSQAPSVKTEGIVDADGFVAPPPRLSQCMSQQLSQQSMSQTSSIKIKEEDNPLSMISTFMRISSQVTSSLQDSILRERQIQIDDAALSPMPSGNEIIHSAVEMVYNKESEKFAPFDDTTFKVAIKPQPFAQGGLRNVYQLWHKSMDEDTSSQPQPPPPLVAKESRHEVGHNQRLAFHCETAKCQLRAAELAQLFNAATVGIAGVQPVSFVPPLVYRLKEKAHVFRYYFIEPLLQGKFFKFNSNQGYVKSHFVPGDLKPFELSRARMLLDIPQAFSHFTHEVTNGEEIVVDIQGSLETFTDPQLHSVTKCYGRADMGEAGMDEFFKTHQCNGICKLLHLKVEQPKKR